MAAREGLSGPDVPRLISRLTVTYGWGFLRQWPNVSSLELQRIWWRGCRGLDRGAVAWALANLPEKPVMVLEFVELTRQAPESARAAPIDVDSMAPCPAEVMDRLQTAAGRMRVPGSNGDRLTWARKLRTREAAGEFLSRIQREAWRVALKVSAGDAA